MGLEVGGGFRIGNLCTPVADSCQCMAKPYSIIKQNKVKIKINKKRKQTCGEGKIGRLDLTYAIYRIDMYIQNRYILSVEYR